MNNTCSIIQRGSVITIEGDGFLKGFQGEIYRIINNSDGKSSTILVRFHKNVVEQCEAIHSFYDNLYGYYIGLKPVNYRDPIRFFHYQLHEFRIDPSYTELNQEKISRCLSTLGIVSSDQM